MGELEYYAAQLAAPAVETIMLPLYDLEHIINSIADPIFVKDRKHRWVLLNDACCKLMGVERSVLIGKSDYDFFPKPEADVFWEKDEQVFASGEDNENEEQFTGSDGFTHTIRTKKSLYISPAGERYIVGCISDLTERKRMEQELQRAREDLEKKVQERTLELAATNQALSKQITEHDRTAAQLRQSQKMEAIGQLAGGIAHDFNNLLNVIIGYGTLVERLEDPKLQDIATHIINAAETAASLTRQLLAFSRKQVLQPEVLPLNGLVESVGNLLVRLIGEEVELEIKTTSDVGWIKVDRGQFEQVIINLAVNARDAMPSGGKLTIETSAWEPGEGNERLTREYVAVKVTDTGKGMAPEVQAHIFEPFFTTKDQGKGTGLGLATVYGIIMQSNGKILVHSAPGVGTTFTILMPKVERAATPARTELKKHVSQRTSGTVLLVEDQRDLRILLREVLGCQGYTVLEAATGPDALEIARERQNIDLLITDIVMPGMRGWELAQKVLTLHPNMKMVYISGHTDTDLINEGALIANGIFLEKPFRPELLLAKLQELSQTGSDADQASATGTNDTHRS
jgi:two-component system, cell cycle sensor histidine kinase and response regulator CckA